MEASTRPSTGGGRTWAGSRCRFSASKDQHSSGRTDAVPSRPDSAGAKDSLFGEFEHDVAGAHAERLRSQVALDRSQARAEDLERSLKEAQAGLEQVRRELDAVRATRAWRLTRPPAHLHHEVRRGVQSR